MNERIKAETFCFQKQAKYNEKIWAFFQGTKKGG